MTIHRAISLRPLLVVWLAAAVTPLGADSASVSALDLDRDLQQLVSEPLPPNRWWPGFDPLAYPLAIYDGTRTFLFRHPSPPAGFEPFAPDQPTVHARDGRHERVIANTSVEIGGVSTATLLLNLFPTDAPLRRITAVTVHELFHVFQRQEHPHWVANEAQLFVYPVTSAALLSLRRQETEALRRALRAGDPDERVRWIRRALEARQERFGGMAPEFASYDRGTELNEGLATYVEMQVEERRELSLPEAGFPAAEVRRRAYATGAALALLLDELHQEWKVVLSSDPSLSLDDMLARAVGAGAVAAFTAHEVERIERQARADVAALVSERTALAERFQQREGWRVEVVAAATGALLWPQGFDPLNLVPIDARQTLHQRILRLGNGAGQLEVLGEPALTEGAGDHPMFSGVRRVLVTGLGEPQVSEHEGRLTVQAPGLSLQFERATVRYEDNTITVELAP